MLPVVLICPTSPADSGINISFTNTNFAFNQSVKIVNLLNQYNVGFFFYITKNIGHCCNIVKTLGRNGCKR